MTTYLVTVLLVSYALWIFFLAAMSLQRAHEAGTLPRAAFALGVPVLVIGFALDFLVNVVVMTPLLLELPREWTVTDRLRRHHRQSTGWRLKVVLLLEPVLDPFDPSGDHV